MKVAVVGKMHSECIGFLCCMFDNIDIYFAVDEFKYIQYFTHLYPHINSKVFDDSSVENFINNYDLIIKVTSNEQLSLNLPTNKKIISILHLASKTDKSSHYITLSPYVKPPKTHIKLFPMYDGLYTNTHERKYIIFVGHFVEEHMKADMATFVDKIKSKYKLIVFSYADCSFLNKYTNTEYYQNASVEKILEYMNQSKFMLCRKLPFMNTDRFSGALSLGLSHNIPLILNNSVAKENEIEYGCITFDKRYCELVDLVLNMNDDTYNKIVENIKTNKQTTIQKNATNIKDFYEKYII